MANTLAAFGALDFQHQGGSQRTEELRQVWVNSTDVTPIFYGDVVCQAVLVSTATAVGGFGPYVTQGASQAAQFFCGVFRGCELFSAALNKMYFSRYYPGSVLAGTSSQTGDTKAFVVTDTSMRFLMQASTGSATTLGSSNIGQLFPVGTSAGTASASSVSGNTVTGNSGLYLASSTPVTMTSTMIGAIANGLPFRLVDFYSNFGPGLLPGMVPGPGTGQFVNGMDNTTVGQYVIVAPWNWLDI